MGTRVERIPASTFRRRRALVLGVLALLLAAGVYACNRGVGGPGRPGVGTVAQEASTGPSASASPSYKSPHVGASASTAASAAASPGSPGPRPKTSPGAACADDDLRLTVASSAEVMAKGGYVTFELTVANDAEAACVRDVGGGAQEILVKAGDERVWSSDDCAASGAKDRRTLSPGEKVSSQVTWNGRSSTPACRESKTVPRGKYQVVGRVGDAWSEPEPFTID